jgi:hypothetical protein
VYRLKDIIWEGGLADSSILATLLGPSDGLSVLAASSTDRLGRSLLIGGYLFMTVKTFFVLRCGTFLMTFKTFFVLPCATLLHRLLPAICVGISFFRLPSPLVILDLLEPEDRDYRLESTLLCRPGMGIWFVLSGDLESPPSSASVRAPPAMSPFLTRSSDGGGADLVPRGRGTVSRVLEGAVPSLPTGKA